jgi:CRISPR-associated protein Cmr3
MKKDKHKARHAPGKQQRPGNISLVAGKPETIWIIEPHDPLIVRDGRPFGPDPGTRAVSLPFPFPSTTTGGARTRAGLKSDGTFDVSQIERVKQIKVRGPLLVELAPREDKIEWLAPAPADALLLKAEKEGHVLCKRLVPLKLYTGAEAISTNNGTPLMLVGPVQPDQRKPAKQVPRYWYWEMFEMWLVDPSDHEQPLTTLGHSGPQREYRLHVSMDPDTWTAKEGALFETSGLEFISSGKNHETRLSTTQRLALAVVVDRKETIRSGLAGLGGERRMVTWHRSEHALPDCPPKVLGAIIEQKACRVLLLTPACFEQGYRPKWLVEPRDGVQPSLAAIAIQRPQVVSGWRFERPVGPKPTRRLAPAGTVLFFSLAGDDKAIETWVKGLWMQCVSDDVQDRNDGFGLAVLGSWSGQPVEMKGAE